MSLPPPGPSDRYELTGTLYKWTVALWNSVFGSIADRLNALEAREADYQEVIDAGTGAAIEYVQNAVAPQIEQIGDTIAGLNQDIAEAQDILDALQNQGVPAANVPVSPAGNFPAGTSVQEALEALDQVTEGIGNALTSHKTGVDVHAEARATTALGRAGTDNSRIMTPYLVRDARMLRTNLQAGAYTVLPADFGQTISCSSTFTLALTAAATLGDGWYCYVRNTGSGIITIDPNGAETIDGAATLKVRPGGAIMIHCNGATFRAFGRPGLRELSDVTPVAAGNTAFDIVSGIDGTYEEIVLKVWDILPSSGFSLTLQTRRVSDSVWGEYFTGTYGTGGSAFGSGASLIGGGDPSALSKFEMAFSGIGKGGTIRAMWKGLQRNTSTWALFPGEIYSTTDFNGIRIARYSTSSATFSCKYQLFGVLSS